MSPLCVLLLLMLLKKQEYEIWNQIEIWYTEFCYWKSPLAEKQTGLSKLRISHKMIMPFERSYPKQPPDKWLGDLTWPTTRQRRQSKRLGISLICLVILIGSADKDTKFRGKRLEAEKVQILRSQWFNIEYKNNEKILYPLTAHLFS